MPAIVFKVSRRSRRRSSGEAAIADLGVVGSAPFFLGVLTGVLCECSEVEELLVEVDGLGEAVGWVALRCKAAFSSMSSV